MSFYNHGFRSRSAADSLVRCSDMVLPKPPYSRLLHKSSENSPPTAPIGHHRRYCSRKRIQKLGSHSASFAAACHWILQLQDDSEFQVLILRKHQICYLSWIQLISIELRDEKPCRIDKFRPRSHCDGQGTSARLESGVNDHHPLIFIPPSGCDALVNSTG